MKLKAKPTFLSHLTLRWAQSTQEWTLGSRAAADGSGWGEPASVDIAEDYLLIRELEAHEGMWEE
jgi:hypothetical protein